MVVPVLLIPARPPNSRLRALEIESSRTNISVGGMFARISPARDVRFGSEAVVTPQVNW